MRARMMLAGVAAAMVTASVAYAGAASTHCAVGEKAVYNCAFGRKVASICLAASSVSYRYGPLGAPELQVTSNGKDGRVFQNRMMGSGGSSETAVRFVNNGYNYVIYVETRGALTDHPNENSSAIEIDKGDATVATLTCRRTERPYLNLELPPFVPKEEVDGPWDHYY